MNPGLYRLIPALVFATATDVAFSAATPESHRRGSEEENQDAAPSIRDSAPSDSAPSHGNAVIARVERQLRAHLPAAGATIKASEQEGQITLDGWVDSYVKREIAQELAESVPGVSAVVNQIRVLPVSERTDEQIAESVRAAIRGDMATRALEIDVAVENGVVRLSGEVQTEPQRRVVGWMASRLIGVRDVVNQIQLNPEPRSDEAIQEDLQEHFATNPVFNENDVAVEVNEGVARLTGTVDSALEKTWAMTDAWVPGVRQVDVSELRVQFPEDGWRAAPVTVEPPSDERIRQAVKRQFAYDPRVYSFEPDVEVNDGVVTLSGAVAYRHAKRAAVEIARHVGGVKEVVDRLEVRPDRPRSDEEIAAAVRAAFEANGLVQADDIEVQATEGAVVLSGTVADPLAKWTAEDLADRTSGVLAVENNLHAAHEPLPGVAYYHFPRGYAFRPWFPARSTVAVDSDAELETVVRTQLAWSPFTDLQRVEVSANDRVVTLEGEVESQVALEAAADHALQAGAKDVVNRLRISGASE